MSSPEKPSREKHQAAAGVDDDAKQRFREALDRKRSVHAPSASADPATVHPHTAPAKPSRNFRRKSG